MNNEGLNSAINDVSSSVEKVEMLARVISISGSIDPAIDQALLVEHTSKSIIEELSQVYDMLATIKSKLFQNPVS